MVERPAGPLVLAALVIALLVPIGKQEGSNVPQAQLASAEAPAHLPNVTPDPVNGPYIVPLAGYHITQYFSWHHSGMDLAAPYGTRVWASKSGVVEIRRTRTGYGNLIILHHANGAQTYYGHLSKIEVVAGQNVVQGQEIGRVGSTGHSTGNHLHFEVRIGGHPVNPARYIF